MTTERILLRTVSIKGQFFMDGGNSVTEGVAVSDTVTFEPEPDNQADPAAVRALYGSKKIGYLQKEVSPAVLMFMQGGYAVRGEVVERQKNGNVIVNVFVSKP